MEEVKVYRHSMNSRKGFTLVEIIVISVIVAILALIAVQIYRGYIREARKNTAENIAASAASFLNSATNMDVDVSEWPDLEAHDQWILTMPENNYKSFFKCPARVSIELNKEDKTVKAIIKEDVESTEYKYDN